MQRSDATAERRSGYDRRKRAAITVADREFLTSAACAALTGLLANPAAHEEQMRWDDLCREAWAIAAEMVSNAPGGALARSG